MYGEEYFKQLTAEQLVKHKKKSGHIVMAWEKVRDRNEVLDRRIIARCMACNYGIDRFEDDDWITLEGNVGTVPPPDNPEDASEAPVPEVPQVQRIKKAPYAARKGWLK